MKSKQTNKWGFVTCQVMREPKAEIEYLMSLRKTLRNLRGLARTGGHEKTIWIVEFMVVAYEEDKAHNTHGGREKQTSSF